MRLWFSGWLLTMVMATGTSVLGDDVATGEKVLFDGTSLEGWRQIGDGRMVLEDGALRTEGGMGLLWYTPETFGDCVIRVEYRSPEASDNSGVYVRIAEPPDDPWFAVHNGYEVQICDASDPFHRTGAVYSLSKATESPAQPGAWNVLEITLDGDIIRVAVNGVRVNEFDPSKPVPERRFYYEPERGPRPESGYIGLQNHGENDLVFFRRVTVQPLER